MPDDLEEQGTETPQTDDSPKTDDEGLTSEQKKRYLEQIEGNKKDADRMRTIAIDAEFKNAEKDGQSLLDLHKKDPKLANEVAKKFGYSSFEDAKSTIVSDAGVDNKQPQGMTEEEFNRRREEKKAEELHQIALKRATKIITALPDDLQKSAQKYFDKITDGKLLTDDEAEEFAEMATLYVNKDKLKGDKLQDAKEKIASNGLGKAKNTQQSTDNPEYVVRNGKLVLDTNTDE